MYRLIAVLLLISSLCACGRTGDLYLPEETQPGAEPEEVSSGQVSSEQVESATPEGSEQDEQSDEEENE